MEKPFDCQKQADSESLHGSFHRRDMVQIGDENYAEPKDMQDITGFIYFYTLSMLIEPFAATIITFPLERKVFLNK